VEKLISTNPSTFEVIGDVLISTEAEIEEKTKLARAVQADWSSASLSERIECLSSLLAIFDERREALANLTSREMGMPYKQAVSDLDFGIEYFKWFLDHAPEFLKPEVTFEDDREIHTVFYSPVGVVAVIVPWNFPFSNFVSQVSQNLIVGNTVVFKHSEETPLFGKVLEEAVAHSGVPEGVFEEIYGNGRVGRQLVSQDIDMICFTGSSGVGRELYAAGAKKFIPVRMELGGSAPGIVFEDAIIDRVLDSIYFNRFGNCGQVCDGLKRLIVHASRFEEVIVKLKETVESKTVGIAEEPYTDIGPLVARRQLDVLKDQMRDATGKGAEIITGGKIPEGLHGAYYEPTLVTRVSTDMRIWQEEVFGPVLPIMPFETYDEAILLANNTRYGLGSYIYTEDQRSFQKASTEIRSGMVAHNNVTYMKPCNPFGGNKESGLGREHGKYGFHDVCQIKVISEEKKSLEKEY
jgi:succinate-semialdehyde dehydrogenase/glutarate-semialdehyde dehydrogenase